MYPSVTHWVIDGGVLLEWTEWDPRRHMMDDHRMALSGKVDSQEEASFWLMIEKEIFVKEIFAERTCDKGGACPCHHL